MGWWTKVRDRGVALYAPGQVSYENYKNGDSIWEAGKKGHLNGVKTHFGGGDYGDDTNIHEPKESALAGEVANNYAEVLRQQWDDYKQRFKPVEDELISSVGNEFMLNQDIGDAQNSVNRSFRTSEASNQRRMRGLGIELDPQEQESYDRQMALRKGASLVDASNKTIRRTQDRDLSIMSGGFSAFDRRDRQGVRNN